MKKYVRAFMMCLTMFCAIPIPYKKWDEEARPLMMLFLPVVGAIIGGLWTLLAYITNWLSLPGIVAGALLCAFPILITGGMHMDGFLDVTDAVRSWKEPEERRKILKDPHVGSFAVINAVLLVMLQFALFCAAQPADRKYYFTLLLIPVVSRCVAGICVTVLRPISTSEYAGAYRKGIKKSHVIVIAAMLAVSAVLGGIILRWYAFAALAVAAGYVLALVRAFRSLGGMSGDVSGYALTFGELCGIAVFALIR